MRKLSLIFLALAATWPATACASSIAAHHAAGATSTSTASSCPDPTQIVDLSSMKAESVEASGTLAPIISNYGGKFATDDARNFVSQLSGQQASAAKLNLGPQVASTDRVVAIVSYGSFAENTQERPPGVTSPPRIYSVQVIAQDVTTNLPALTFQLLDGCSN
jgi:hypothetical protein